MSRAFNIGKMDCCLLLTSRASSSARHAMVASEVEADLRASIAADDTDKVETEELIGQLFALNLMHIGWYVRGLRDMLPQCEVFTRPNWDTGRYRASVAGPATPHASLVRWYVAITVSTYPAAVTSKT